MNFIQALIATVIYILLIEFIGFWHLPFGAIESSILDNYYFLIQGIIQVLTVIALLQIFTKSFIYKLPQSTKISWYLIAIALGVIFVMVQMPLMWVYNTLFNTEFYNTYSFDGLTSINNLNKLSVILFIPLGEELFFREYIQRKLHDNYNPTKSIGIASLMFAFIHSPYLFLFIDTAYAGWHQFYLVFFGGVISGYLYFKSKSIGPSIVMHVIWNVTVSLVY